MNNDDTKTTKHKYPRYNDGTVLTSQDLNNSFDFLHEQLKDTRSLLFGQGILNGLTCKYDKNAGVITITPGMALTASGSLIELHEEMNLRYCVDKAHFSKRGLWDEALAEVDYILESDEVADGIALADLKDNDNYLLGLQVLYKEVGDEFCTDQSCSIRGKEVEIEFVPFLKKSINNHSENLDSSDDLVPELNAPSVSGWADYKVLPIFLRKVVVDFYDRIEVITNGLNVIDSRLAEPQWEWLRNSDLQDSIERLKSIPFKIKQIHTHLSFVNDLHEAVNEFICFFNDFQSKYRQSLGSRLEEAVILGNLIVADENADDTMRYTLKETYRDYDKSKDERILVRLLKRITLMIDSFSPVDSPEMDKNIRFVPSSVNGKLGERMVPHYYQKGDLYYYWDAYNDIHAENLVDLTTFGKADLFRLDFDNLNADVVNDLRGQAKKENMSVIVLKYELEGDDVSYCLENYKDEQGKRTSLDSERIANLIFEQKFIDEKEQKDCVKNVINEIWNCYEEFDVKGASKKMADDLRETLIEEIRQSIYVLTKKEEVEQMLELAPAEKNALEFVMMAILYHRCGEEVFNPLNMPGVDFVGGVEKRDVMLLVTYRDKVLTCLNMPYLSLVLHMDEKMFKDQLAEYNKEEQKSDLPAIFALKKRG